MSIFAKFSFPVQRRIWQLFWNEQKIWISASCFFNKYQLEGRNTCWFLSWLYRCWWCWCNDEGDEDEWDRRELSLLLKGSFAFCFKDFIYLFLERGREGEREGEKYQCVVASCTSCTRDLACNPGMWPDWELNRRPFGSQADTQYTEPHQLGQVLLQYSIWKRSGSND